MDFSLGANKYVEQLQSDFDHLKSDIEKKIKSVAGFVKSSQSDIPWSNEPKSKFFIPIDIDPDRWDKLFPYRLMVVDVSKGNKVVNGASTSSIKIQNAGNSSAIINFEPLNKQWIFTLPITPQQLSITDQYAINTSATLRGVLEEHGGLKFKMINASGSMGIWPYRQNLTSPPSTPSVVQSVFGGTIEAFNNLKDQAKRVISAATSNHPAGQPTSKRPENVNLGPKSTGLYLALSLQQFLEQYAEAKTRPENAGWRLVFDIPKQSQSLIVTPLQFNWTQSVNSPNEIKYTFQLKAWRRISLKQKISDPPKLTAVGPGILNRVLNTVSEARRLTSSTIDLIRAVRSDVTAPLNALRQTSLFVKDLAGVAITASDLPYQIQRDYSSAIKDSLNNLRDSIDLLNSSKNVRDAMEAISKSTATVEGLTLASVASGTLGNTLKTSQTIDPANNVFKQPERNFTLMDQVPINNLSLDNSQQDTISAILEDARLTTVDDLKQYRSIIQELALQLSNNFGSGNAFYNQIYGRPAPSVRSTPITLDEYELLKALYEVLQSYDILTATTDIDDSNRQSNMDYVAGLADDSGIAFTIPNSKILVPVPFGLTVEGIAQRYLGDSSRWLEIVTLNNLRDPYIDENGFTKDLLSNAIGRQITIGDIENLYLGQRVILRSSTQKPSYRKILGIDRLSDTSFLITLDGEPNLDNFITLDKAYLQAYLPGTTNSQQKIFIPSDLPVPDEPSIIVPSSTAGDPLTGMSKVDWLLTDSGDIAVNSYGDFRLSSGMTNLIQAIKIKLSTLKGTFLLHPDFGLSIRPGLMNSETNAQEIYDTITRLVEEDPRFERLENLKIEISGPSLFISMVLVISGQTGVFPLTFEFKN
jgi:hypothetical protein